MTPEFQALIQEYGYWVIAVAALIEGESILLAPQLTWLYPMTERGDPLPELSLLPGTLPTPGKILSDITAGRLGGDIYDRELPERVRKTLY